MVFALRDLGDAVSQTPIKFLGVHLDQKLQWSSHLELVAKKLARGLYLLRGLRKCVSPRALRVAYFGIFHAHLSYAILAWGHAPHTARIFALQRKAIRLLAGLGFRDDCRMAFAELGVLTLPSLFAWECLLYMKRDQGQFRTHTDNHDYSSRNRDAIIVPYRRLRRCQNGPGYWAVCTKFNEIGSKLLSRGFIQLEKRHGAIYKRVKSALPRRESERKSHPLARHSDILQAVETRMSMLNMTYMRYIENRLICFVPGKVLDEAKSILDLVESNKTPPRTHQLLQELRDLSSMAMEHFDEHILPRCKEQLDQRTGSPEKILKELEVVAGYPKFQDIIYKNVSSSSKSTRLLFHQQLPTAISNELYKVKKVTKNHKHHITYLTQNTQKLCLKVRRQANKLRIQTAKIREQERKIQEQNSKLLEQEATLIDIKKHIDEWDQKYKDLTTELVRARDEILLKATAGNNSPLNSSLLSPPAFGSGDDPFKTNIIPLKSNIKPRAAHILPKSYLNFDCDRKRKSSLSAEIPIKRNRSPSAPPTTSDRQECSPKMGEDIQNLSLNIPDMKNFEIYANTVEETDAALVKALLKPLTDRSIFNSDTLTSALNCVKARKRKMAEDIDLK